MARKEKSSMLEDLIYAPWWVSLIVLIIGNIGIRFIIPAYFQASASSNPAGGVLVKGIGGAMPAIANMFSLVLVFVLALSLIRTLIQSSKASAKQTVSTRESLPQQRTSSAGPHSGYTPKDFALAKPTLRPPVRADNPSTKPTKLTQELLNEIEWKRFETLCATVIYELGLDAKETQYGADGGIDIVVNKRDSTVPIGVVQCKAGDNRIIGLKPVRELLGVMAHGDYKQGMFMTTGSYTQQAIEFAKGKITLVTGTMLVNKINSLPQDKLQRLMESTFEGDYRTPTCPKCGIKMVPREAAKGRSAGSTFWGCANYPKCRQTLVNKQDDE